MHFPREISSLQNSTHVSFIQIENTKKTWQLESWKFPIRNKNNAIESVDFCDFEKNHLLFF